MTRAALTFLICALALVMGLASASVQSHNHQRAARLDELKRECDRIEAEIQGLEAETMRQRYELRHSFEGLSGDRPPSN